MLPLRIVTCGERLLELAHRGSKSIPHTPSLSQRKGFLLVFENFKSRYVAQDLQCGTEKWTKKGGSNAVVSE